ncbi:MAG TPA: glutathione transferase GstA [Myxococcales bacterium]|nr:glutathione transferase GstA [Myxococcales bacterium]
MKLYYARGACSLSVHIALREAGLAFDLVKYDIPKATLEAPGKIQDVNVKGYVPVLVLDDGQRLTEVAVVLQYVADRVPDKKLAPPAGTMERYRLQEWLNFTATEIHKLFWPFFHEAAAPEKPTVEPRLRKSLDFADRAVAERPFLMGETFTVADCYLFNVVNWIKPAGLDVAAWPHLRDYRARILERPAVRAAMEAEGLLKRV